MYFYVWKVRDECQTVFWGFTSDRLITQRLVNFHGLKTEARHRTLQGIDRGSTGFCGVILLWVWVDGKKAFSQIPETLISRRRGRFQRNALTLAQKGIQATK